MGIAPKPSGFANTKEGKVAKGEARGSGDGAGTMQRKTSEPLGWRC